MEQRPLLIVLIILEKVLELETYDDNKTFPQIRWLLHLQDTL
jgi:hypothetical protein